jgi:hypothetical protein
MAATFLAAQPFPYLVQDDRFDANELLDVSAEIDAMPPSAWHRYDSPDERGKRACHQPDYMGALTREILAYFTSQPGVMLVESLTGLTGLFPDPSLYGGGVHVTDPGGFLGLHLDNEIHPRTGMHRRLNLIIYCTPKWYPDQGGNLELWDRDREGPVVEIAPYFNRTVLMATDCHSYHGHPQPTAATAPPRKSLAVYYWSPPRARARFVAAANEPSTAEREAARLARSTRHTGPA